MKKRKWFNIKNNKGYINLLALGAIIMIIVIVYMFVNKVSPEITWQLKNGFSYKKI